MSPIPAHRPRIPLDPRTCWSYPLRMAGVQQQGPAPGPPRGAAGAAARMALPVQQHQRRRRRGRAQRRRDHEGLNSSVAAASPAGQERQAGEAAGLDVRALHLWRVAVAGIQRASINGVCWPRGWAVGQTRRRRRRTTLLRVRACAPCLDTQQRSAGRRASTCPCGCVEFECELSVPWIPSIGRCATTGPNMQNRPKIAAGLNRG